MGHVERDDPRLRPPPPAHRLQPPGRSCAHQGPDALGALGLPRRSGGRHDRPRQHARRGGVLQGGAGGGRQAHPRPRGLRHQRLALREAAHVQHARRRLLPPDPARQGLRRLPEPLQALQPRLPRGLLHEAARRSRAAGRAQRGHHRALGLPRRPDPAGGARHRRRRGRATAAGLPRHLRRRLLHRAAEPRPRRAGPTQPRAEGFRGPLRARHGGDQRRPLRAQGGCPRTRGAAVDPDQDGALRPEPVPLPVRRVLRQDARRDGGRAARP